MLKKILLALDGSENAERALPWIKRYAGPQKGQVVLFRAVDADRLDAPAVPSEILGAKDYLLRIEKDLNYAGIPTKIVVREGRPAEAIVRTAIDEGCELILLTTRGGSKIKRWFVGGVTEKVLRTSPVPVLPIRSQTALPKQGRVRRIIVPVDGSKVAEDAVPWVEGLAKFLKSPLVFLHVVPEPAPLRARREERLEGLKRRMTVIEEGMKERGVKATFKLQRGDAADRILKFADRDDLIVTTTHGFGGLKRWLFGSVAERLVRDARIPVLVYKSPSPVPKARAV